MSLSKITKPQAIKIVKAVAYSFASAFLAAVVATNFDLSEQALLAAVVAGINGALVTVKQAFTEG